MQAPTDFFLKFVDREEVDGKDVHQCLAVYLNREAVQDLKT